MNAWQRRRRRVLRRHDHKCVYCGAHANTIDHVVPVSRGGTDDESNLVAACDACNQMKRDRSAAEFVTESEASRRAALSEMLTDLAWRFAIGYTVFLAPGGSPVLALALALAWPRDRDPKVLGVAVLASVAVEVSQLLSTQ